MSMEFTDHDPSSTLRLPWRALWHRRAAWRFRYLFREEGQRTATLVSYKDLGFMLLGLVDVADMQSDIDLAVGGAAAACSRKMEVA